jgi:outer membrane protein assembly factor BamD
LKSYSFNSADCSNFAKIMMHKKSNLILFLFAILLVFAACSDFSRVVKGDNYELKLAKAEELFAQGSYNRALVLYEQVYQRFPKDEKGELAYFQLGMTYFNMEDFFSSSYYFTNFVERFRNSRRVEQAMFYSAMSAVNNSPEPSLDQAETVTAINELQLFISSFPNSPYVDSCNRLMDDMRFKLEEKAINTVRLYDRMERYNAAKTSAAAFIEEYPSSKFKDEAAFIQLHNAFQLANKSVFSKKRDRLEKVVAIYDEHRDAFQLGRNMARAMAMVEEATRELDAVEEQVIFEELSSTYNKAQQASTAKKIEYLEETLRLYYTFVQRFPSSSLLGRAEEIYIRAERERSNTYSY